MATTTIFRLSVYLLVLLMIAGGRRPSAQDNSSRILVDVDLVPLNVAVTDGKGNYVTGLRPEDFAITEDKISEKIATFEEGSTVTNPAAAGRPDTVAVPQQAQVKKVVSKPTSNQAPSSVPAPDSSPAASPDKAQAGVSRLTGASVFILFDTSNYMYRGFVFAQDAVEGFARSMDEANRIAFYSYSRDLSRATPLTSDREELMRGVRGAVAGDDAALYNCLLLTVRDAAPLHGRKAIVVFSNGPDNASSVPPEDVEDLAQSTGTIIYIISTRQAQQEPVSSAVFERMSKATGGKAYFARDWPETQRAFAAIQDDLAHLYTLSYYPRPNPNPGWRKITVKLVGKNLQKYHVRTRDGYRLRHTAAVQSLQPDPR